MLAEGGNLDYNRSLNIEHKGNIAATVASSSKSRKRSRREMEETKDEERLLTVSRGDYLVSQKRMREEHTVLKDMLESGQVYM
jgi:hypothetical protein